MADSPFAHDDDGNLIAVTCNRCGSVVAAGYSHECTPPEEIKWLRKQLHSPDMQCRQCDLTRQILDELEANRG